MCLGSICLSLVSGFDGFWSLRDGLWVVCWFSDFCFGCYPPMQINVFGFNFLVASFWVWWVLKFETGALSCSWVFRFVLWLLYPCANRYFAMSLCINSPCLAISCLGWQSDLFLDICASFGLASFVGLYFYLHVDLLDKQITLRVAVLFLLWVAPFLTRSMCSPIFIWSY